MRAILPVVVFVASCCAFATPALACLHAMKTSKMKPVPTEMQAVIGWNDGVQDLVLSLGYESKKQGASPVAYVVPVPNVPTNYSVTDPELFPAMNDTVSFELVKPRPKGAQRSRGLTASATAPAPLEELLSTVVGPYQIQPLKAYGSEGLSALNTWMTSNDFAPLQAETAAYYVERGWTFLAIKVDPEKEAASARLPPLQITFPSSYSVLPLKLLNPESSMTVRAFVVTEEPLPSDWTSAATSRGFHVIHGMTHTAPEGSSSKYRAITSKLDPTRAPRPVISMLKSFGPWAGERRSEVTILYTDSLGTGIADPKTWGEDLAMPGAKEGEQLLGGGKAPLPVADDSQGARPAAADPEAPPAEAAPVEAAPTAEPLDKSPTAFGCAHVPAQAPHFPWLAGLGLLAVGMVRRR